MFQFQLTVSYTKLAGFANTSLVGNVWTTNTGDPSNGFAVQIVDLNQNAGLGTSGIQVDIDATYQTTYAVAANTNFQLHASAFCNTPNILTGNAAVFFVKQVRCTWVMDAF